jgi:hypothetical protein
MPVSTIHKIDKIVLPSSVEFSQVVSSDVSAGIQALKVRPPGHPHVMFSANQKSEPGIQFTTQELTTLLDSISVGGAAVGNSSYVYYKLATETGAVARATASHHRLVIAEMLAYWNSITLPHNGSGEAQVMLVPNFDGTNAPIVYAGSVALSGNLTVSQLFGAGPAAINGTQLPAIQNIDIQSGVQLLRQGGDSEEYDTFIGVETTDVIITIQLTEAVNWGTIGLGGTALDGTDGLEFYARAYANKNSRKSNATEEHIYFQATDGQAVPVNTQGQGSSAISDTIRIECIAPDDSTLPLIATTDVAISAFS